MLNLKALRLQQRATTYATRTAASALCSSISSSPLLPSLHYPQLPLLLHQQQQRTAPQSQARWYQATTQVLNQQRNSKGRIVLRDAQGKKKKAGPKLCVGCGVEVVAGQNNNNNKKDSNNNKLVGFQDAETESRGTKKKKGRYVDLEEGGTFLCNRCKSLRNSPDGFYKATDVLADISPKVFMDQLKTIVNRRKFGFAIQVVDATDVEGTLVNGIRNAIGSFPIIMVVNKIDLLPAKVIQRQVWAWKKRFKQQGFNAIEVVPVSAHQGDGMLQLAETVLSNLRGRDVFVVGSANVGKSTLVKSLSNILAQVAIMKRKKRRDAVRDLPITISHLPGTTLQAARIPCFSSHRHALWDTPGIINESALTYSLFPSRMMEPLALPSPIVAREASRVRPDHSILLRASWLKEGREPESKGTVLGRLDVTGDHPVEIAAFCPEAIHVEIVPTVNAPGVCRATVSDDKDGKDIEIPLTDFSSIQDSLDTSMDIIFFSLGWISIYGKNAFSLQPWVAKGSRWAKRIPAFYPTNLKHRLQERQEGFDGMFEPYDQDQDRADHDELDKETIRMLRDVQRSGRHNAPKGVDGPDEHFLYGDYHEDGHNDFY